MSAVNCQFLKDSLINHLMGATAVELVGDSCVITLPIPTLDGRLVDVFVEGRMADYFLVHDGGKAVNELILQGVRMTDSITDHFDALAKRFKISYADEMFTASGKFASLQDMILSVGMCSGLAMTELIGRVTALPEEPVREQFGHALRSWIKRTRRRLKVSSEVPIKGRRSRHKFDFVATPKGGRHRPIAMSVLTPGSNPLANAERFGFLAADLDSTPFQKWPRVAVESRAEVWTPEAKNIVGNCADVVIELPTGSRIDADMIANNLGELVA